MRPSSPLTPLDHAADGVLVGDVGRNRDRAHAARGEFGDRGLRLVLIAADHRDVGAGVRKAARHAEPDAAIAAGDDGDLALQIKRFHRVTSRCFQLLSAGFARSG